jgi:hypothetical protein
MKTACLAEIGPSRAQFGLARLLEYVTVCAILAALSGATGAAASVCLMLMALALGARQGVLALALFAASCLAADAVHALASPPPWERALFTVLLAAAVSAWYRWRSLESGEC